MAPRHVFGLLASLGVLAIVAGVSAYHIGLNHGFERGLGSANSSHSVGTGVQALELLKALNGGNDAEVRQALDLLVDVGISSHFLHLQVPEAMGGEPDEAQQWLYEQLVAHRRQVPSTVGQTRHIGPQVAKALAASE